MNEEAKANFSVNMEKIKKLKDIINWIDGIVSSEQKTIKNDIDKCMDLLRKENWDYREYNTFLQEIRDYEREIALFSLLKEMLLEINEIKCSEKKTSTTGGKK